MSAKIFIADHNSVTRKTIRSFLGWHSFQIRGEARCCHEAVAKVRQLKPDIVLQHINMPDMDGIRTAYEIPRVPGSTKIVFLSAHDAPRTMKAARMWADGFAARSAGIELFPALCRVAAIDQQPERE
jgi:DNA-binding NarL/FixJ family response regulator